eukprot:Blabericola_migrator_1__11843@NODE_71_length_15245_cov_168_105877_g64_i0_p5_GENE_NODE_71_length_15245_cov_168_105877_g64_i0NODE_71_length_15245_cov_168_105877_g64_i0_p5_ORF_typecomplete_len468_score67_38Nucleoporin_FG/PF13634_6/2_2e08Nucleoporin_FG/PF13634_6/0_014Nucleoporin_FG/PF13634_6/1_3e08Nucleoporin_FG/PF13634_6/0_00086Nup54/PF13874_6/4_8e12CCDC158/PF15921_5/76CCDC158/PF15921_5/3_3_NODE_71_length_15245_cov_168_105877_g64_i073538756
MFSSTQTGGLFGSSNTGGGGLFGSSNTNPGGGLFGSTNTGGSGGGLFGSTNTGTTGGGLFGSTSTGTTGGGLFGSTNPGTTGSGGGLFGSTNPGITGSGGGLFGSSNAGTIGSGGGLFGSTNTGNTGGGGLFGSTNTGNAGGSGLFGSNTGGGLFGSTNTTSPPNNSGGGLFGNTSSGGLFGNSSGGGILGANQQSNAFGGNSQQQWMTGNSFGLGLQDQSQEAQVEILKSQLMAYGIDLQNLPPPLPNIIPRIQNPNLRTLQLLVHLVGRMLNIKAVKDQSSELMCFVFTRAPSVEIAQRLQLQCDQNVSQMGAQFVQKLLRAKKNSPEPKSHYFTRPVFGFQGLKDRVKEQSLFFETFGLALTALRERQQQAKQKFTQTALEKLKLLRQRQAELRQKLICLVGGLEAMASRAQGYDGDDQEVAQVEEEYERLQRHLTSNPECLQRTVPVLRGKISKLQKTYKKRD